MFPFFYTKMIGKEWLREPMDTPSTQIPNPQNRQREKKEGKKKRKAKKGCCGQMDRPQIWRELKPLPALAQKSLPQADAPRDREQARTSHTRCRFLAPPQNSMALPAFAEA
jgi:hypothetical protein